MLKIMILRIMKEEHAGEMEWKEVAAMKIFKDCPLSDYPFFGSTS
jgi:hypothetical protein